MRPKEAFDTIERELAEDPGVRIVKAIYFEDLGGFHFAFRRPEQQASIVCDRGQVFVCDDLEAKNCKIAIEALYDIDEKALAEVILACW